MICYNCEKASGCSVFRTLHSMSNDFCINECKDYDKSSKYKYRKIAEHDDLMHLIYDYFTEQIKGDFSDEEIIRVIKGAMWDL